MWLMVKGVESSFVVKGHAVFEPRCGNRVKIWKQFLSPANAAHITPNDNTPTALHLQH